MTLGLISSQSMEPLFKTRPFIAIWFLVLKELQHFISLLLQLFGDNILSISCENFQDIPKNRFSSIYIYLWNLPSIIEKEDSLGGQIKKNVLVNWGLQSWIITQG